MRFACYCTVCIESSLAQVYLSDGWRCFEREAHFALRDLYAASLEVSKQCVYDMTSDAADNEYANHCRCLFVGCYVLSGNFALMLVGRIVNASITLGADPIFTMLLDVSRLVSSTSITSMCTFRDYRGGSSLGQR